MLQKKTNYTNSAHSEPNINNNVILLHLNRMKEFIMSSKVHHCHTSLNGDSLMFVLCFIQSPCVLSEVWRLQRFSPVSFCFSGSRWATTWRAVTRTPCRCATVTQPPPGAEPGETTPPSGSVCQWRGTPPASRSGICHLSMPCTSDWRSPIQRARKRAGRWPSRLKRTVSSRSSYFFNGTLSDFIYQWVLMGTISNMCLPQMFIFREIIFIQNKKENKIY